MSAVRTVSSPTVAASYLALGEDEMIIYWNRLLLRPGPTARAPPERRGLDGAVSAVCTRGGCNRSCGRGECRKRRDRGGDGGGGRLRRGQDDGRDRDRGRRRRARLDRGLRTSQPVFVSEMVLRERPGAAHPATESPPRVDRDGRGRLFRLLTWSSLRTSRPSGSTARRPIRPDARPAPR